MWCYKETHKVILYSNLWKTYFPLGAKVWRYDPLSSTWSTSYTLVFVGEKLKLSEEKKGACRDAFKVEYINQEEPMGRYRWLHIIVKCPL